MPWEQELRGYCAALYRLAVEPGQNWFTVRTHEERAACFTALKTTGSWGGLSKLPSGINWVEGAKLTGPMQPALLRDIFRHPDLPAITLPTLSPEVVRAATDIYDQTTFERLPDLALALQAAGCDNDELLDHLRGPGPHVRGCWALDFVLGKT